MQIGTLLGTLCTGYIVEAGMRGGGERERKEQDNAFKSMLRNVPEPFLSHCYLFIPPILFHLLLLHFHLL